MQRGAEGGGLGGGGVGAGGDRGGDGGSDGGSDEGSIVRAAMSLYRRHARAFVMAACLMLLPLDAVIMGTGAWLPVAAKWSAAWVGQTAASMLFRFFASIFSSGAVVLLALDLETGGAGGWRLAWRRALARAKPLATSSLAATVVLLLAVLVAVMPVVMTRALGAGPLGGLLFLAGILALIYVSVSLCALLGPIAILEQRGGFTAVKRAYALLRGRGDVRFRIACLAMAGGLLQAIGRRLSSSHPHLAGFAASLVGDAVVVPLIALAGLAAYRQCRKGSEPGYDDSRLPYEADTIDRR